MSFIAVGCKEEEGKVKRNKGMEEWSEKDN